MKQYTTNTSKASKGENIEFLQLTKNNKREKILAIPLFSAQDDLRKQLNSNLQYLGVRRNQTCYKTKLA